MATLGRDGWGGLIVLMISIILFVLTLNLPDMPLVPVGPGFYPRIVLTITGVLGLWMLAGDIMRARAAGSGAAATAPRAGAKGPETLRNNYAAVALHFAVFGLYVAALGYLGFRLSTLAYVAATNALMDPPKGMRGYMRVTLLAVLTAFITFILFERYLSVLMPRGRWTGF